jgi:hypothetical protein
MKVYAGKNKAVYVYEPDIPVEFLDRVVENFGAGAKADLRLALSNYFPVVHFYVRKCRRFDLSSFLKSENRKID